MQTAPAEAPARTPEGTDVNWLVRDIGWPFPTWIDPELHTVEFNNVSQLVNMFNDLGAKIDKALATDAAERQAIVFKYWRYPHKRAVKKKPLLLKATIYRHPQYNTVWMHVEEA